MTSLLSPFLVFTYFFFFFQSKGCPLCSPTKRRLSTKIEITENYSLEALNT